MKKLINLLFLVLLGSTVTVTAAELKPVTFNKLISARQERQVSNFNSIAISGSVRAVVKIGNEESIRLSGDQEAISELITEVKGGILIIRPKTKWMDWNKKFNNTRITAFITAKNISSLTVSGSGSIEVEGSINATALTTTLSGSGSIKVAANVKDFTAVISGSGNLNLSGKANEAHITIAGSGDFKGAALSVEKASTKISGSGSIYITANKSINAVTLGSGTVYYNGNPTVEKTVVGSGGVKKS